MKKAHRRIPARDAHFLLEAAGFHATGTTVSLGGTSVATVITYPDPIHTIGKGATTLPKRMKKDLRNWAAAASSCLPLHRMSTPSWRHLTDPFLILYFGRAVRDMGPSVAVTVNLSDEVEAEARQQEKPIDWLARRLGYHLKARLGRPVAYIVVGEETNEKSKGAPGRLHLHGVLGINDNELERARGALKSAAGDYRDSRQVKFKEGWDDGWLTYMAKNWRPFNLPNVARLWGYKAPWAGPWYSTTNDVRTRATKLWERDRASWKPTK